MSKFTTAGMTKACTEVLGSVPESISNRGELTQLVAYLERESMDPVSGEAGILRKEWRVDPVSAWAEDDLILAWSDRWRRYRPEAAVVLTVRYIRRGVEEPWHPFEAANTFKQALEYIDSGAVACCPEMQELIDLRERCRLEQEEKDRLAQREKQLQDDLRRKKKASSDAFERLMESPTGREWAIKWNEVIRQLLCLEGMKVSLGENAQFVRLHAAVVDATTVPSKRKAIKICLAWLDSHVDMETGELK